MDGLTTNPAFRTYAICAALLALKMIASAVYTGLTRRRSQGYVNAEDARVFGAASVNAADAEVAAVAHALRIQRNDLENIPIFLAIALVYVLSGAEPDAAARYMWTFTGARAAHTVFYTLQLQPWRAIAFGVGAAATIGMCVRILIGLS